MSVRAALPWVLLLCLFLLLRGAAGWPRGVDRDENQDSWNARCLSAGGTDFRGNAYPLVLEDYGDDKSALYAWLLAGIDKLGVDVRPERARLLSMLFVGVGGLLFGLAFAVHSGSSRYGLAAFACAAFLPWFQVGPCLGWECATSPPAYGAMFLGLALAGAGWRRRGLVLFLAGLAFGVYGYPAPKVLAPVLLAAAAVLFWPRWRDRILVFAAGGLLCLPLLVTQFQAANVDRARQIAVGDATTFVTNWLSHWLPPFLALRGDLLPRHFAGFLGVVPIALLLAAILGLSHKRSALDRFALVCLVVFPLPAALTQDGNGHVLRTLLGGFAFTWFGVTGIRLIAGWRPRVAAAVFALALVQSGAHFVDLGVRWRDAPATRAVFHGTFYGDLREHVVPLGATRVFFDPSIVAFIHFAWTAFDSRPVPGEFDADVSRLGGVPHLATRGKPLVRVYKGQAAEQSGLDILLQPPGKPAPAGFEERPGLVAGVMVLVRGAGR